MAQPPFLSRIAMSGMLTMLSFALFSPLSHAEFHGHYHLTEQGSMSTTSVAQTRADNIYHKCVHKAKRIADERVCESERAAIHVCMRSEMKLHDGKASQSTCERLFLM